MIKHFSIQPSEESLNTFLESHEPDEVGYPRLDMIDEDGKLELKYRTDPLLHDYSKDYLTFEVVRGTGSLEFSVSNFGDGLVTSVSYSKDDGERWNTTYYENGLNISINNLKAGDKILFKGIAEAYFNSNRDSGTSITSDVEVKIYGNIMSMLYGDDFLGQTEFVREDACRALFGTDDNYFTSGLGDKLINAKNLILPATTLTSSCYEEMFYDCTSLTEIPELPATILVERCYKFMFSGCSSLTDLPELPATTLAERCYCGLFRYCTSLVNINANYLPVISLTDSCYLYMFSGCTSLTIAPELPATTLAESCYSSMFEGCTSLTRIPELPATTLAEYCYSGMFNGCTSLISVPTNYLPIVILDSGCYSGMFRGCTALIQAPELPATSLVYECYSSMFEGCTSLTTAPDLPATTLVYKCYFRMFWGCSSLNHIKAMFTTTPSASSETKYTAGWVSGVASSGTFIKNSSATWNVTGTNGIPSGWTVQTASE